MTGEEYENCFEFVKIYVNITQVLERVQRNGNQNFMLTKTIGQKCQYIKNFFQTNNFPNDDTVNVLEQNGFINW